MSAIHTNTIRNSEQGARDDGLQNHFSNTGSKASSIKPERLLLLENTTHLHLNKLNIHNCLRDFMAAPNHIALAQPDERAPLRRSFTNCQLPCKQKSPRNGNACVGNILCFLHAVVNAYNIQMCAQLSTPACLHVCVFVERAAYTKWVADLCTPHLCRRQ